MAVRAQGVPASLQQISQFVVPTTGQTVTVTQNATHLVIEPAGGLAALTITLYTGSSGQSIDIFSTNAITTVTWSANVFNGPSSLTSGQGASFAWNTTDSKWHRCR